MKLKKYYFVLKSAIIFLLMFNWCWFSYFLLKCLNNAIPPPINPLTTATGSTAVPNNPTAPMNWRLAKREPAATLPIPAWIPAAMLPVATPPVVNPTDEMAAPPIAVAPTTLPTPIAVPTAVSWIAFFVLFSP